MGMREPQVAQKPAPCGTAAVMQRGHGRDPPWAAVAGLEAAASAAAA